MGTIGCFSFYANKLITMGEGGMVVTADGDLAERCRYYKNLCFPLSGPRDYSHDDMGFNYRISNMQAAVGLAQLEMVDELLERRRTCARWYAEGLGGIPGLTLPLEKEYAKNSYWMYSLVVDEPRYGVSRDRLIELLKERGIESRPFFKPLHRQNLLKKTGLKIQGEYPVSDFLGRSGLYLPSGPKLVKNDIEYICETIQSLGRR
jgi:perosamine synthetase